MIGFALAVIGRRADDRPLGCVARVAGYLSAWRRRAQARQMLAQIDHRTLRDAGIDPVSAQYEAAGPFWTAERRLR